MTGGGAPRAIGRYLLYDEIASGGMASVHVGRLLGPANFSRTVAIKRLHPQYAKDPEFESMFVDEARLAARIRHPNVVSTLDVVSVEGELYLVLDYIHGDSLASLLRTARTAEILVPLEVSAAIVIDSLLGLHAAHEAKTERGQPLGIVHRDVSPQNILVGVDGVARVADFGVAKAADRVQMTREGQIKGKIGYMAPEQLEHDPVDRRTDVFAAGVVLWETLTGQPLFSRERVGASIAQILQGKVEPPSRRVPTIPKTVDQIVLRAVSVRPEDRYPTAQAMAEVLRAALPPAPPMDVGRWVEHIGGRELDKRSKRLTEVESGRASNSSSHTSASVAGVAEPSAEASPLEVPLAEGRGVFDAASSDGQPTRTDLSASSGIQSLGMPTRRSRWSIAPAAALVVVALLLFGVGGMWSIRGSVAAQSSLNHGRSRGQGFAERGARAASGSAPSTSGSGSGAGPPSSPARVLRVRPRKPDCNPPYTVDKNGNRRFKRECF